MRKEDAIRLGIAPHQAEEYAKLYNKVTNYYIDIHVLILVYNTYISDN